MNDERIIKTYVRHGDAWFFVSTIERDCSAVGADGLRYNETMVWETQWPPVAKHGELLYSGSCGCGSIVTHQQIVERLFAAGAEGLKKLEDSE